MLLKMLFKNPILIIGSVFGLGYLPVWSRHWAAFVAILINMFIVTIQPSLSKYDMYMALFNPPPEVIFAFSANAMIGSVYLFILSLVFGWLFLDLCNEQSENFTIDVLLSQFLVLAFCGPPVMAMASGISRFTQISCENYLMCPEWLTAVFVFIIWVSVPLFTLRLFDILEFWPGSYLHINYTHSALATTFASMSASAYTIFVIYLVGFLLFQLSPVDTVNFIQALFLQTALHFYDATIYLMAVFGDQGALYQFLAKLGLIDIISNAIDSSKETGSEFAS